MNDDLPGRQSSRPTQEPRAGDVRDSQADISKARALLGYEPIVSFEEGLRHTLEWCRTESAPPPVTPIVPAGRI